MSKELIQSLLEAGVHFGHQTRKWNPKMKPFIFGEKSGIYIIDLQKSADCLTKACNFIRELTSTGASVMFVGTKPQAQEIMRSEAERSGMYYVNHRWLGGMLTNYQTVRKSVQRYKNLIQMREDGTFEALTKKEVSHLEKDIRKLETTLGGVVQMDKLPGALIVVDAKREGIAIQEANRLKIPVIALVDTDSNPDFVQHPIPANDDAIRSIKLIIGILTDSLIEGAQKVQKSKPTTEEAAQGAPSSPAAESTAASEETTKAPSTVETNQKTDSNL